VVDDPMPLDSQRGDIEPVARVCVCLGDEVTVLMHQAKYVIVY
jgi:hypothetical protein